MELALELEIVQDLFTDIRVSILVFVELALEPFIAVAAMGGLVGFNPCFRGTRS